MIAGYYARDILVEFVQYLGLEPRDHNGTRAREIQALFDARRRCLEALELHVKPGRFHAPAPLRR
jgi:hypothetical protein